MAVIRLNLKTGHRQFDDGTGYQMAIVNQFPLDQMKNRADC
jgi:hypothetical protein